MRIATKFTFGLYNLIWRGYDKYLIPCFIGVGRPAEGATLTKQIDVDYDAQIHWERF